MCEAMKIFKVGSDFVRGRYHRCSENEGFTVKVTVTM